MGITLLAKVFVEEGVEDGWLGLAPAIEVILALAFLSAGLILLVKIARQGWTQAGLFSISITCTMALSLLQSAAAAPFNRDDIAWLAGPAGLIFSILVLYYTQTSDAIRAMLIGGVGFANAGAAIVAARAWSSWFADRGALTPLLPLLVILTGLLILGPSLGGFLNILRRSLTRKGLIR